MPCSLLYTQGSIFITRSFEHVRLFHLNQMDVHLKQMEIALIQMDVNLKQMELIRNKRKLSVIY